MTNTADGARSALNDGLAVNPWIDESVLRKAIMTPEQEQIVERGRCPKCGGKLQRLSAAENMSFNGCERCNDVWVLTANVQAQRGCAALSRSVRWSAVLGVGTTIKAMLDISN